MTKGCNDCSNQSEQGKAYIDSKTGLLCATICEKYDKPKNTLVIVPYICTTCGTTSWKTLDTR